MTNPFFDFVVSVSRFVPRTRARAEDVNARLDEVTVGFDGVNTALALKAPLASPALTGVPTAPTAAVGTDTTQLATTAFVRDEIGGSITIGLPTTTGRRGPLYVESDVVDWKDGASFLFRLPILQVNTGYEPAAGMDSLPVTEHSTGLTGTVAAACYGASLFVVSSATAQANVASSADAETWVARGMPASAAWMVGSDGTSFVAAANGGTQTAVSADGITWSAGGALPANGTGSSVPMRVGGLWLVVLSTTTYATSSDGTTWTSRSFPVALASAVGNCRQVGSTVWIKTGASTAAYTTTDGINWTLRSTPVIFTFYGVYADGTLVAGLAGSTIYTSTDGISWTDTGLSLPVSGVTTLPLNANSVLVWATTESAGGAYTYDDRWVRRSAGNHSITNNNFSAHGGLVRCVANDTFLGLGAAGNVAVLPLSLAHTALFSAL